MYKQVLHKKFITYFKSNYEERSSFGRNYDNNCLLFKSNKS